MKTQEVAPWNVKVGDRQILIGPHGNQMVNKVLRINKYKNRFAISGTLYVITTDCPTFSTTRYFGPHRFNGRKFPCEKVRIMAREK